MKQFNEDFKTKLVEAIENIENNSLVEIITVVKTKSENYKDISVWAGAFAMMAAYSFMMFSHWEINVYLMYFASIFVFFGVWLIFETSNSLKRIFISKKRMTKSVEIMSRAIFQKVGIRFTNQRIGILFFVSITEKKVVIIPDRGAETAIPFEVTQEINNDFQTIFIQSNIAEAFVEKLNNLKTVFNKYLPPIENDINELPDFVEINF